LIDTGRLKESWSQVTSYGEQVPLRFYSRLFVLAPQARELFPLSMVGQRDRFVVAMGRTVAHVDRLDRLRPYLEQLGRDHRRYGVLPEHYQPVGEALMATLADFLGPEWTPELAEDWERAYQLVASIMVASAQQDAAHAPAWWDAELVAHERRTFDIAVLTLQPESHYPYRPGQSAALEVRQRPNVRRYFSPANAPRHDGTIDLHVRRVPGGRMSSALVDEVEKGDIVRLGPPVGHRLVPAHDARRDMLLVAGGTGLAPLKAIAEQAVTWPDVGSSRWVTLVVGVRTARELYDIDDLCQMEAEADGLTLVVAVADQHAAREAAAVVPFHCEISYGSVGEVARQHGPWPDHDVYVCGSDPMVRASVHELCQAGCPPERIHHEGFESLGGDMHGVIEAGGR
jgi:NAD(P)H-flavin reductase/hemoglobin-like flavoprotein